jgi:hypothetical protein
MSRSFVIHRGTASTIPHEAFSMIQRYILAWFPIVILAVMNGAIRDLAYKPFVGDLAAHQISTVTLIILLTLYLWLVGRKWRIGSGWQAWFIGSLWLLMTIAFEFGLGHYVLNHPWEKLLRDYNVLEGRVWVFILLAVLTGPYASFRWLQHKDRSAGTRERRNA